MSSTETFFIGTVVQVALAVIQVAVLVRFVYHWQRSSWRYGNLMLIRAPLARAYCSLSAVAHARERLVEDTDDPAKTEHDQARLHHYLGATQDEIVNFSVEHFKARFWLAPQENNQLDHLFDCLRESWRQMRNPVENPESLLESLRQQMLKFDEICGIDKYNGGKWSHVALHT